jgi:anti-sigma regulatory factor (Ser/Thr protein kinase)
MASARWGLANQRYGMVPERSVWLRIEAPLSAIRQRVRELLAGRTGLAVEDAVLVTDELVSNAYRHGLPPRTVRITARDAWQRLLIEVTDASPAQPMLRSPDRTGGLGLMLIDRLTTSWGVRRHDGHKTVWAELDLVKRDGHGHTPHLTAVPDGSAG